MVVESPIGGWRLLEWEKEWKLVRQENDSRSRR